MIVYDRPPFRSTFRSIVSAALCCVALSVVLPAMCAAEELKFAWPVPSRVTVSESTLKRDKTAKIRYDIVLNKQKTGDNLELRFDNFELLQFNDLDVSTPEGKATLGPALPQIQALQSAMPTLVINKSGEVVDVVGMEELVEKGVALLPDPTMRESMRALMSSPAMTAQIKAKTQDFWRVWVGAWIGCSAAAGKDQVVDTEVPVMPGKLIKVPLTIHNDGPADGAPGNIKLSGETILQGEEATKALAGMMQQIAGQIPVKEGAKPFSPEMLKEMKRTSKFSVVTNPKTLQPQEAHSEIVTALQMEEERRVQTEKHDYVFDWKKAE